MCLFYDHVCGSVPLVPTIIEIPTPEEIAELRNSLDSRALDEAVVAVEMARRVVEARAIDLVRRADVTGSHFLDGHRTITPWVESVAGVSTATARHRTRCAHLTEKGLHSWVAAIADGTIGVEQAIALGRVAANPRVRDHLADAEEMLLAFARTMPFAAFTAALDRWVSLADEDGTLRDHDHQHRNRWLTTTVIGNRFILRGETSTAQGTVIEQLLAQFVEREFQSDAEAALAEHGEVNAGTLPRTHGQRAIDALVTALEHGASNPRNTVRPVVNLLCDIDTFEQWRRFAMGGPSPVIDPTRADDHLCESATGAPIDPRLMVEAALAGRVRSIILDGDRQIVAVNPEQRLFDRATRDAVRMLNVTCYWPGCTVPAEYCETDHLVPHRRGGPTVPANAGPCCRHHNRFKADRWYASRRSGRWRITRPDGTTLSGAPPPGPALVA
jgi:hypothetical protein